MKKIIFSLSLAAAIFVVNANAQGESGKTIFEMKGCALCHKTRVDTIGPSLKKISTVYMGKEMSLLTYLRGQGESIVDPSRASVMQPQLVKISSLSNEDTKKLAEYIVSATEAEYKLD